METDISNDFILAHSIRTLQSDMKEPDWGPLERGTYSHISWEKTVNSSDSMGDVQENGDLLLGVDHSISDRVYSKKRIC